MTRRKNKSRRGEQREPLAVSHSDRLRPWLLGGMMALCVARPLFPSESAASFGDGLTMVMLWIALAVFWLLGAVGGPHTVQAGSAHGVCRLHWVRFGWTDAAVLLLIGWHTVAALWAVGHGAPRPAINMLWEWVGMGLCFWLARQFITTAREARAVAATMIGLAVALAGYGLYQYVYEMPNTRAQYQADPDRALRDNDLWYPPGSPERSLFESRLANKEPTATFALTNSLAAFLAPWLVMLAGVGFAVVGGDSRRRTVAGRQSIGDWSRLLQKTRLVAVVVCLIPIAVCMLLTKSRSGYIAAGTGLTLAWLLCRQRKIRIGWKWPAAIVALAAVLGAVAVTVGTRDLDLLSRASRSFGYRLQYWQSSLLLIADHPIVGCGPGNFQNAYTQYKLPEASEEVADAHNFLLEIWATAGTPAVLAFLAVLGCFAGTIGGGGRGAKDEANTQLPSPFGRGAGGEGRDEDNQDRPQSALTLTLSQRERGLMSSSNPQSLIPNPSVDAWPYVLAGGAAGFLLSVPLGLLSAAPPGMAVVLLGLPLAAAAVMLMLGWIREGRLPRLLPAIGVVVLLVDLLAAGGIGLPSVAGTFWLLLALGLQGQPPRALRPAVAWVGLLAAVALAIACYRTAYSPVLGCQAQLRLAQREPGRAVERLEAATAADPWAAEPWRQLAAVEFERWWQQPDTEAFDRFERASAKALELAPNSAPAWLTAGDWYFRASSKTDRDGKKVAAEALDRARSAYQEAVRLYPNSALYRAKLAEVCRAAGDQAGFRREAEAALRLDGLTPHTDKKLPAEVRNRLAEGVGGKP